MINLDQLRDLRPMPVARRAASSPASITMETRNFRALRRTHWTPSGVCVLVGPNGAGKTTLLTLLEFLRNAYLRSAPSAIDHIGGVYGLRSWGAPEEEPVLVAVTVGDLRWELQLTAQGPTLSERLGERVTRATKLFFPEPPCRSGSSTAVRSVRSLTAKSVSAFGYLADADNAEELGPLFAF